MVGREHEGHGLSVLHDAGRAKTGRGPDSPQDPGEGKVGGPGGEEMNSWLKRRQSFTSCDLRRPPRRSTEKEDEALDVFP